MADVDSWMRSGRHLPAPLRDFHDQKDLFKAMHEIVSVEGHDYAKEVGWVTGQCYVIDIFLWFMARRGYTLQRSRQRLPFRDLGNDIELCRKRRDSASAEMLRGMLSTKESP